MQLIAAITLILAVAWLVTAAMRRTSAALRHLVWICAIGAALLCAPLRWILPQRAIRQPLPAVLEPVRASSAFAPSGSKEASRLPIPLTAPAAASILWALGSALLAVRFTAAELRFRSVFKDARLLRRKLPVPILISERVPGPLVAGVFRPKIILPGDCHTWPPQRLRAVLAHELAHVRRRDPVALLASRIAVVLYWFHPLCRLALARLRIESELACDDSVLRIGLRPSAYAGELLGLARLFNPQPAIPMAATSHLESRVKSILNPLVNRSFVSRRAWLAALVVTGIAVAPLTVFTVRAQGPEPSGSGSIAGTVSDPTGAVVPRVRVFASNRDASNREVTTSDSLGAFTFANIPAGRYSIEVQAPGFALSGFEATVANGATVTAPMRLTIGNVGQQLTVTATGSPQPAQSSAAPAGGPIRVGGNIQPAILSQKVPPIYPASLQAAGIEGTVLLEAVISKDGIPLSLKPRNTQVEFAFVTAALDAVSQWRYTPATLNGEPIELLTTIDVDFKLQQNAASGNR